MLNVKDIQLILERHSIDFSKYNSICGIFVTGSLARGKFIKGWSDIDLIVVGEDTLQFAVLKKISIIKKYIQQSSNCHVGIDYVSKFYLNGINNSRFSVEPGWHFLKNFHESNKDTLLNGSLYIKKDYAIPFIADNKFINISYSGYLLQKKEQVYESLMRNEWSKESKQTALRTITKSGLYLSQVQILNETGNLISDYDELIKYISTTNYYPFNTDIFNLIYTSLNYDQLHDPKKIDSLLHQSLTCFNKIVENIETKNSQSRA